MPAPKKNPLTNLIKKGAKKAVVKVKPKPNLKAEPRSNVKVKPTAKTKGNPPNKTKEEFYKSKSFQKVFDPAEGGYGDGPAKAGKARLGRVAKSATKKKK